MLCKIYQIQSYMVRNLMLEIAWMDCKPATEEVYIYFFEHFTKN